MKEIASATICKILNSKEFLGAGEASADVPEGEEDKAKDDDVTEGIVNNYLLG